MAYMIKHNYEPCESLLKNKIKQRELVAKALLEIKNTCFIVKNTGEIGDFHYIEFKKEVDEKWILKLINMVCCKAVGKAIYIEESNAAFYSSHKDCWNIHGFYKVFYISF